MSGNSLTLLCLTISRFRTPLVNGLDVIQGNYHVWWAPIPLPKDIVTKMLPGPEFQLSPVPGLSPELHLVVFEMGREENCGPIFPAILMENFMEFKFEIPFMKHDGFSRVFNYKEVIYVDNAAESLGSRVVYKLNASVAQINMTENQYTVNNGGIKLDAKFEPIGQLGNWSSFQNASFFEQIFSQRWFGSASFSTCADHHYEFTSARVRWTMLTLVVDHNLINPWLPDNTFILGVAEVIVNWTMTTPFTCKD